MLKPFAGAVSDHFPTMYREAHSIGMTKSFSLSGEFGSIELRHGVEQDLEYSVIGAGGVTVGFDMFEFTPQNLGYALALANPASMMPATPAAKISHDSTTNLPGTSSDIYMIWNQGADADTAVVGVGGAALPVGPTYTAMVWISLAQAIAGFEDKPEFYTLRAVGILPHNQTPIIIDIPRVQVTSGFNMPFGADSFGSMRFEGKVEKLRPTDPMYETFGRKKFRIYYPNAALA